MLKSKQFLVTMLSLGCIFSGCDDDEKVAPDSIIVASAGPDQNVNTMDLVRLDGRSSKDSKGEAINFNWQIIRQPAGSTSKLAGSILAEASFIPDISGEYEIELSVSNATGTSRDHVVISAAAYSPVALVENINARTVLEDRIANPDIPDYIANKNVNVKAELQAKPGVVIAFARDTRMYINDGGGSLIAVGNSEKPVRFIGKEPTKGFWAGLVLNSSSSANKLEFVQVAHAGSQTATGKIKAGLALMGGSKSQVYISNSTFELSGGYGLLVEKGAILNAFEKNTFRGNQDAGMITDAENLHRLDVNSVFENSNGRKVVEVTASQLTAGTSDLLWQGFKDKTPYRFLGDLTIDTGLKLSPGIIMEMGRGVTILINGNGFLNARATGQNSIVIRGAEAEAGFWKGLICFSPSPMNVMEYTEISGGGSVALVSGRKTNIAVYGSQASMQIRNSRISKSTGYGVFVNYQASVNTDIEEANMFTDNVQGKVFKEK